MKRKYVAPQTEVTEVELEDGFMKASVVDKEVLNSDVTAGNQEIENTYDFTDEENIWK